MLSSFLSPPFARSSSLRLIAGAYVEVLEVSGPARGFFFRPSISPKTKKKLGWGFWRRLTGFCFWLSLWNGEKDIMYGSAADTWTIIPIYAGTCDVVSSPFISFTLIFFSAHKLLVVIRILLCVRPLVCSSTFWKIFSSLRQFSRWSGSCVYRDSHYAGCHRDPLRRQWHATLYTYKLTNPQVNKFEPRSRSNRRPVYTVQYLSG